MYTVRPHTAPMTGMAWFIVVDEHGSQVEFETIEYWDDFNDAQHVANQLNGLDPDDYSNFVFEDEE